MIIFFTYRIEGIILPVEFKFLINTRLLSKLHHVTSKFFKNMIFNKLTNPLSELPGTIHPVDLDMLARRIYQQKDSFESVVFGEFRFQCKNGSDKWILMRSRVAKADESGNPVRIIGINTDIHNRKKLEESVLENIRKEIEMYELRARLLTITSTDFKTPLMSMILKLDVLSNYMDKMNQAEMKGNIRQLSFNAALLTQLTDNRINLVKLESAADNFSALLPQAGKI